VDVGKLNTYTLTGLCGGTSTISRRPLCRIMGALSRTKFSRICPNQINEATSREFYYVHRTFPLATSQQRKALYARMKELSFLVAIGGFLWLTESARTLARRHNSRIRFRERNAGEQFGLSVPTSSEISTNKAHRGTKSLYYHPFLGDSTGGLAVTITSSPTVYARWWWWIPRPLQAILWASMVFVSIVAD